MTNVQLGCESSLWHAEIRNKDGCSNGLDDFPIEWVGEPYYFFSTTQECCNLYFPDRECKIYTICDVVTAEVSIVSSIYVSTGFSELHVSHNRYLHMFFVPLVAKC